MASAVVQKKTVFITGCSNGSIGAAISKILLTHDFHVFAGVRSVSKATDLSVLSNVDIVEIDVTLPETISKAKQFVAERTGGKLDVLVSVSLCLSRTDSRIPPRMPSQARLRKTCLTVTNQVNTAGVEGVRPLLDVDIAWAKEIYDVNVWGILSVIQEFAPLVIEAKGIIANFSSIGSKVPMCWAGIYSSSKAAIAQLSETLRIELAPLGVRVVTVMCGSANTPIFNKPGGQLRLPERSYYAGHGIEEVANKQRDDHQGGSMNVDELAQSLVKGILSGTQKPVWAGTYAALASEKPILENSEETIAW
ncbi:hypothetical protein SLS53_002605 [Cytospora paraplurivora]|uniref:Uncharacterized protein n=1 Tax=Cytospora paraplurivora TaxID=2898453 RepID=A0AAN9UDG0_9PEZI